MAFDGTATASYTIVSDSSITATVGSNATGPISVTNPGGTATSTGTFTIIPQGPAITSFTPTAGPVGQVVTITGTYFTSANAVLFNGVSASFLVVNDTTLTATVPTGATTGPISVTTPIGTTTSTMNFYVGINLIDNAVMLWVPGGSFTMGSHLAISTPALGHPRSR